MKRKILVIEYDVTDLNPKQIDRLMLEAVVQGEASDDGEDAAHPDVPVITTKVVERSVTFDPDDYLQVWTTSPERALQFFGLTDKHKVVVLKAAPETDRERERYRPDAVLYGIRATPAVPGSHADASAKKDAP
jgi:hypothetical protein